MWTNSDIKNVITKLPVRSHHLAYWCKHFIFYWSLTKSTIFIQYTLKIKINQSWRVKFICYGLWQRRDHHTNSDNNRFPSVKNDWFHQICYMSISFYHHTFKEIKIKTEKETWSRNWLKGKVTSLWKTIVTDITVSRKREYFGEVSNSLRSSPCSLCLPQWTQPMDSLMLYHSSQLMGVFNKSICRWRNNL